MCRRESHDGGDIGVLTADSLLYGGNQYRIVKQLSSKQKEKRKKQQWDEIKY